MTSRPHRTPLLTYLDGGVGLVAPLRVLPLQPAMRRALTAITEPEPALLRLFDDVHGGRATCRVRVKQKGLYVLGELILGDGLQVLVPGALLGVVVVVVGKGGGLVGVVGVVGVVVDVVMGVVVRVELARLDLQHVEFFG